MNNIRRRDLINPDDIVNGQIIICLHTESNEMIPMIKGAEEIDDILIPITFEEANETVERPIYPMKYMHFKNKEYKVIAVAKYMGELFAVYEGLYGQYLTYARPLEMFLSEVDRVAQPTVTTKYRMTEIIE